MSNPIQASNDTVQASRSMADTFTLAHEAFIPAPDDNPDAVPFYRAYAGLKQAWGAEFVDEFHTAIHQIGCHIMHLKLEEKYPKALELLRYNVEHQAVIPKPQKRYQYHSEPDPPTEQDVVDLFNEQFRGAYPGKRINSKFAKEKWSQYSHMAKKAVQERYERAKAAYQGRLDQEERDYQNQLKPWQERMDSIKKFAQKAESITSEEQ